MILLHLYYIATISMTLLRSSLYCYNLYDVAKISMTLLQSLWYCYIFITLLQSLWRCYDLHYIATISMMLLWSLWRCYDLHYIATISMTLQWSRWFQLLTAFSSTSRKRNAKFYFDVDWGLPRIGVMLDTWIMGFHILPHRFPLINLPCFNLFFTRQSKMTSTITLVY